jgi:transposase
MYIERVPNRNSPPAILLRESFREGKSVRKRTIANLSDWPEAKIEALRAVLRGQTELAGPLAESFDVVRSRPHGHVAAVLGALRKLELETLIDPQPQRMRDLATALIVARVINPRSKLALARGIGAQTLFSSLGEMLGIEQADEDDLYAAMDWLLARQARIESALAKRHLSEGSLVLYDLTSTWYEGRTCPLARIGHSRDGRKGTMQILFGLICNAEGCPVAVEVFEGNLGDPATVATQIDKVRSRFGLERVVLVGDRGMITEARIRQDLAPAQIDWITALRSPAIRALLESGTLQLSLFDERDLVEVRDPAHPGERLVACRNPLLAQERTRKRGELLEATERELRRIAAAVGRERNPLRSKERIALRVGAVLNRYKVGKHFIVQIADATFSFKRDLRRIAAEAALDGIYVVRTSLPAATIGAEQAVLAYKSLSTVERAFRCTKTVDLKVRPIFHRLAERVRAHLVVCMLAYHVEWHLRRDLAPLLFQDDDKAQAAGKRSSVVAKAQRSDRALRKVATKRTAEGDLPVHSFATLLEDLSTIVKNRIRPAVGLPEFDKITLPTRLQRRAFELLGLNPPL